jgi:hypothetical protein
MEMERKSKLKAKNTLLKKTSYLFKVIMRIKNK